MFCIHCGKENVDGAQFCVQCGKAIQGTDAAEPANAAAATEPAEPQQQTASAPVPPPPPGQHYQQESTYQQPYAAQPRPQAQPTYAAATTYPMTSQDETLRLINFILCILSCVTFGWAIFPLAWMIPMTVHSYGIYKGTKPNTTAFGVCTLIFVNVIGGILLLVSNKDD